ncbi:unnamed protein product [Mytilus edulis]|uniref:EF-hand domain-containing protein n=1 Tax=Mytilus edulis TaxID=6550 RepID=A0A8S3RT66_MYTED|nr:unnamed protein product [Mytilus edulis]
MYYSTNDCIYEIEREKKKKAIEFSKSKGTEYSFDVPCNLINYDIDNNDVISIEEFAEALRQHEENTGSKVNMNKIKLIIGFVALMLLFHLCTAGWRVDIKLRFDGEEEEDVTKEKPYSFDVPCNLIDYDLDNNDLIGIEEFAEALNQHVENTGVRRDCLLLSMKMTVLINTSDLDQDPYRCPAIN